MPLICYTPHRFDAATRVTIDKAVEILEDYARQGYDLTLRQIYYQFVARGIIANKDTEYKRLGSIVNDARLAGLIDWDHITDRTRNMRQNGHWDSPRDIIASCGDQFRIDKWAVQDNYVECFMPDTPVVVHGLPTSIASLSCGDVVFSHTGTLRKVTRVIRNHFDGRMLRINTVGLLPVEVTPGHPFFAEKRDMNHAKSKGTTRKLLVADWVRSNDLTQFDMLRIPLLPEKYRRGCSKRRVRATGGSRSRDYEFLLDDRTLKVCGLYVAEGAVRGDGRTIQFTLNVKEQDYADTITAWARYVGASYSEATDGGARVVYIYSKALANWLEGQFGNGSHSKRLPEWAMFANRAEQLTILEFYFRGDACLWDDNRSAFTATTRSITLARQIQLVFLWNRYACALNATMDHGSLRWGMTVAGQSVAELAEYWKLPIPPKGLGRSARYNHLRFTEDAALFPIRRVDEFDYRGEVWNLEVEEDHSYCVPVATHNCWVEKDALVGVLEVACKPLDVPYFSCRGYTSQSEMWAASQRLITKARAGKSVHIVHLGDHDPSGIDMSRDILDRLTMFMRHHAARDFARDNRRRPGETDEALEERLYETLTTYPPYLQPITLHRIALNMDQVEQYDPPPNPAKLTDARARGYIERFGDESWELDALEPSVITELINDQVAALRDDDLWDDAVSREQEHRNKLAACAKQWNRISKDLEAGATQ